MSNFDVVHDPNRAHKGKAHFGCRLDVELDKPWKRSEGLEQAGVSDGYLLTATTHFFVVAIEPLDYPCVMDIFWRLEFLDIECSQPEKACNTSAGATAAAVGLEIDVTEGWLTVWSGSDIQNATVEFTVSRADCSRGCQSFKSVMLKGDLVIVNATSRCDEDCGDYRIFPMRIPVWYNWADALTVPPSTEAELPAWLWWLVAALVVFLGLLLALLYQFWWKSRTTGAALSGVQDDLDAAVQVEEHGFGHGCAPAHVGFNPLATGFNPNAAAGGVNPNAPPNGVGGARDFVKPNVEKQVFRQEYGQEMGKYNQ
jgi:hypothetical protein